MERRLGIRRWTVQGRLQIGLCLGSVNCNVRGLANDLLVRPHRNRTIVTYLRWKKRKTTLQPSSRKTLFSRLLTMDDRLLLAQKTDVVVRCRNARFAAIYACVKSRHLFSYAFHPREKAL